MHDLGEKDDELWNVYDRDRNLTVKVHRRGQPLSEGDYHLVVHICIFNSKNEVLIQKRQPWKRGWPDMWDLSAAGSAIVGDDSRNAAEREVKEELGLTVDLSKERPILTINFKNGFDDYWVIKRDVEIDELILQYEEVAEARWASKVELEDLIKKGEAIPYKILDYLFEYAYKL
ncbi:MAG: hydrolase [Anaerocolumna sp.]|jgi:isopentenyldiphosphate isomerase|nr:hydrolase [Anaerocolumna sp.]